MLQEQGCVFQERHGWERPGWFNRDGPAPVRFQHTHTQMQHYLRTEITVFCVDCWFICLLNWQLAFSQVLDYDYYGAYDVPKNTVYKYSEILGKEYTFAFPPHHDVVSKLCRSLWECLFPVPVFIYFTFVYFLFVFRFKKKLYIYFTCLFDPRFGTNVWPVGML